MYGWGYNQMGGAGWFVMVALMIAFWAVVVIGVVMLLRRPGTGNYRRDVSAAAPEATLRERFARGELDEEEFRARMKALKDHP